MMCEKDRFVKIIASVHVMPAKPTIVPLLRVNELLVKLKSPNRLLLIKRGKFSSENVVGVVNFNEKPTEESEISKRFICEWEKVVKVDEI